MKIPKFSNGFTLVEILVAISILSIIGAISIPNLRNFNEGQILQNTTNDLARILRQAQSSASSHIQCSNTFIAREWVVGITSTNYTLRSNCYNPVNNASMSAVLYSPSPNNVNGVTLTVLVSATTSCADPIVRFSAEYMPYAQDRFSNIGFSCGGALSNYQTMEIILTKDGSHQYICIDKGGAIYAAPTVCPGF